MISALTVTNSKNQSLRMDLFNPSETGLAVIGIDGLGPTKANIEIGDLATIDGGVFISARQETRNIVVGFVMTRYNQIEELRHTVYKYFPMKDIVTLTIETGLRTLKTTGYVESNEPNIFSSMESAQVSIICPDPFFYVSEGTSTSFTGLQAAFEFPFGDDTTIANPTYILSSITHMTDENVYYEGEAAVGITATLYATGTVTNPVIKSLRTGGEMKIDSTRLTTLTGGAITIGDQITICTVKGNKYVKLVRNATEYNILNCINTDAEWFQITQGDNVFRFSADDDTDLNMLVTIENEIKYEGV